MKAKILTVDQVRGPFLPYSGGTSWPDGGLWRAVGSGGWDEAADGEIGQVLAAHPTTAMDGQRHQL
ncbi:hypothetical protein AB0K48_26080 [Nonomuraea sp. NPDC055795]